MLPLSSWSIPSSLLSILGTLLSSGLAFKIGRLMAKVALDRIIGEPRHVIFTRGRFGSQSGHGAGR